MSYLTAADFLSAIVGQEEDVLLPGMGTVRIRPLTTMEVGKIYASTADSGERMALAVAAALVEPKLDEEQAKQLYLAAAGRMAPLVQRVMALAGMLGDEEAENLAGGGS